jgi:hypothetical protein
VSFPIPHDTHDRTRTDHQSIWSGDFYPGGDAARLEPGLMPPLEGAWLHSGLCYGRHLGMMSTLQVASTYASQRQMPTYLLLKHPPGKTRHPLARFDAGKLSGDGIAVRVNATQWGGRGRVTKREDKHRLTLHQPA